MRKMLFGLLVSLVFLVPGLHATTHAAASCSASDVNAAIALSVTGDTVTVPGPCTVSWSSAVDIPATKGITVQASGSVTLTNYGFTLKANASAGSRITGFTFTYGDNTQNAGSARAIVVNNGNATVASTWRADHNTFTESNSSVSDVWLVVYGNGPGLIDHNTFTSGSAAEPIHVYGPCGPGGCGSYPSAYATGWTDDVVPGGPLMVFIEDNIFNETGTANYSMCAPEAYGGAREVVRYNTFNNCYVDVHGTGYVGGRWWEIYNNNFNTSSGFSRFAVCQLRAGSGVLFNNYITGSGGPYGCQMEGEYRTFNATNTVWPNMWQVGSGIGGWQNQHSVCGSVNMAPAQAWNNTGFNIYGVTYDANGNTQTPSIVQVNRDFFVNSSQPASIHWMEAAVDTCSTTYTYTPYTYPHPLTLSGNSSGVLNPPTNLRVVAQ